jgi:hypothetical protein
MMRSDIQQAVAAHLDAVMRTELTDWLGRERYQRTGGPVAAASGLGALTALRSASPGGRHGEPQHGPQPLA